MENNEIQGNNRYIHACRETVALYNSLPPREKNAIPFSLIRAFCDYAGLEEPEDQEAGDIGLIQRMSNLTAAMMQLVFFYSGVSDKQEAIHNIRKYTQLQEREIIRQILLRKQEIETQETGD